MKNNRLKKILYLSALSTMLLTGCNKSKELDNITTTTNTTPKVTKKQVEQQPKEIVSNQTIAQIIKEYRDKTGNNTSYQDFKVDVYDEPKYVWKTDEGYTYDYRIDGSEGYEYVDCTYKHMAVVKVNIRKNGKTWYMPICALVQLPHNEVENVVVTTFDDENNVHDPYEEYIYVNNPTMDKYYEIVNADEYLNATYKEPAIEIEPKEYTMLYKNN